LFHFGDLSWDEICILFVIIIPILRFWHIMTIHVKHECGKYIVSCMRRIYRCVAITLRVALLDPSTQKPAIRLAIEGRGADGWYTLCQLPIKK